MRIIAVDDEEIALENLADAIREAEPNAEVTAFDSADAAYLYASENKCASAFLDINMGGISGIALFTNAGRNTSQSAVVSTGSEHTVRTPILTLFSIKRKDISVQNGLPKTG